MVTILSAWQEIALARNDTLQAAEKLKNLIQKYTSAWKGGTKLKSLPPGYGKAPDPVTATALQSLINIALKEIKKLLTGISLSNQVATHSSRTVPKLETMILKCLLIINVKFYAYSFHCKRLKRIITCAQCGWRQIITFKQILLVPKTKVIGTIDVGTPLANHWGERAVCQLGARAESERVRTPAFSECCMPCKQQRLRTGGETIV
ncbi:hypothetical protein DFH28DRAFT_923200 [Melampsora americana]|nr:hypothetical protein DFH28DRAFT_923200 [Melampsora americana]